MLKCSPNESSLRLKLSFPAQLDSTAYLPLSVTTTAEICHCCICQNEIKGDNLPPSFTLQLLKYFAFLTFTEKGLLPSCFIFCPRSNVTRVILSIGFIGYCHTGQNHSSQRCGCLKCKGMGRAQSSYLFLKRYH